VSVRQDTAPPGFLALAGHPVRWRLLAELAQTYPAFRAVAADLETRIGFLLARIGTPAREVR
jgi:hypothetical protein